ncbi:hypothetical protein QBC42DRAFT_249915 [Cladorrhinum samala]|uniref:Uncharacterized protein n=1 Tax=Cladorrhinum samala TaxID=585594 RepID=A0AAV9HT34_9PEZI|nr:hypothetical protein QBC42DRAFT_249915 [Cladorrhinum samala]
MSQVDDSTAPVISRKRDTKANERRCSRTRRQGSETFHKVQYNTGLCPVLSYNGQEASLRCSDFQLSWEKFMTRLNRPPKRVGQIPSRTILRTADRDLQMADAVVGFATKLVGAGKSGLGIRRSRKGRSAASQSWGTIGLQGTHPQTLPNQAMTKHENRRGGAKAGRGIDGNGWLWKNVGIGPRWGEDPPSVFRNVAFLAGAIRVPNSIICRSAP